MPWYDNWSDGIKKRACRYLLQRYLGQFLEEKLTLDQLSVDIYNGTGSVSNVSLDVQALNELGEQKNLPIEFIDGYMEEISVSIPWSSLFTDSIYIEVSGMQITIQPRQRVENGESMLESMWTSVTSSMQLAAECLKPDTNTEDEKVIDEEQPMDGLEKFAQTIESVLTRVKIKFIDTTLRLEHLPKEGKNGIAFEIRAEKIEYCDETSSDDDGNPVGAPNEAHALPMFTIKKFHCNGISLYTDEFPCESRTFSRSVLEEIPQGIEKLKSSSSPILFGKLSGVQEVRLKSKKQDNLSSGPKFELEFSLGSLSLFISPRQLYLLIEIMHSLSDPHTQDTSNVKYKKSAEKLISSSDYRKIEQDLNDRLYSQGFNVNNGNICGKGWASNSVEESDDEFFPFGSRGSQSASLYSNYTDMSWETTASTVLSSKGDFVHSYSSTSDPTYHKKQEKGNTFDFDFYGETIAFYIRLSSIAIVILHEDILTFSTETYCLTPSSVSTMNNLSTNFFEHLSKLGMAGGFGNKDFETSKVVFQNACTFDHIRILGAAVILEGREGGSSSHKLCNTRISAASFELLECLFEPNTKEPEYVELLKFMKKGLSTPMKPHFPLTNQPDIRIMVLQSKKTRPNHIFTKSDVTISLQQCWSEIDLSLYDRLSTIFTAQTLCLTEPSSKNSLKQSPYYEAFENAVVTDRNFHLKIQCPFVVIKFRFPIPDMRPDVEKGRHPWWKRSIRKDVLFVNIVEPIFQTEINYHGTFVDYKLQCNQISLLLQIGDSDKPIPFLYSAPVDLNDTDQKTFYECPRLSVKLCKPKAVDEIEVVREKEDNSGLTCSFMETPIKEASPFTSKRFVYKGDSSGNSTCEGEEVVLPASKEDLNKFINEVLENSKYQVDVVLPYIYVDFSSKHLYEVLYNRFSSDVSLWQSSVSKIIPINMTSSDIDNILPRPFLGNAFSMCKSGLQMADLESEEENDNTESGWCRPGGQADLFPSRFFNQSNLALQIHISNGHLNICPNLKDSLGNIVPNKHGELQFTLDKCNIFCVSGHKGDPHQMILCFQVENLSVNHEAVISNPEGSCFSSETSFKRRTKTLKPIIYKSNFVLSNRSEKIQNDKSDMFTLALSSCVDSRKIKTVRVSCGIKGATLRHYVTPSEHSWLTQLMDFFDVVDYPVKGYDSPQSITELYLNLEESLVDYRPINIKTKCAIYFGNFSISSNIAARTKTSTLRFIAEETNLFISEKCSNAEINIRKDYVSVIDLGLFELSLRLSDQPNLPKVDLKSSSDIFNIRTCADSATSLAKLITYYASNGDLNIPKKSESTVLSEPYLEKNPETKGKSTSSVIGGEVHDMMEDAMKEFTTVATQDKPNHLEESDDVEVFYFPDEGRNDGHEVAYDWAAGDLDSDSDFYFVENEPITSHLPEGKHPTVHFLSDKPIQVIENHFNISLGKTDFLLPPKYYPSPVYRYTLSDMNLVWHMFGGSDFSTISPPKKKLTFDFQEQSPACRISVNTGNTDPMSYQFLNSKLEEGSKVDNRKEKNDGPKTKRGSKSTKWFTSGGPGRELDVLMQLHFSKVRFQHEIYPDKTTQASRQVLLIHNFEIRDKLLSSHINKFLYQYTSESNPRQSNANMVMVKVVHLRPDTRINVQETCLKVSLLPLRLNIDQDSLEFLYTFFCQLSNKSEEVTNESNNIESSNKIKQEQPHSETQEPVFEAQPEKLKEPKRDSRSTVYIRNFIFTPDVPIRIDYEGKRVNMSHGPMAGIIMGIGQLNCLQIKLKRLAYRQGLLGWDRLLTYVFSEWLQDIKKTQFPCIIGGVGPMHALVRLIMGIKDLFWLPIEQYQKDGRIFRGIQRGANSFTTSTVIAALELTARIVQAIQSIAEAAFDMVSPGPSVRRIHGKSKKQQRYSEPADIREGVTNAYTLVKEGIEETAETLVRVASAEAEQKGAVGAVGGVLRQIPPSVVAPIIIASAATTNLLGGVRNQLAPDSRREASFKWKANDT